MITDEMAESEMHNTTQKSDDNSNENSATT